RVGADIAARPRLVLHHDRLPEPLVQPVGDDAGDDVGRRAGAERDVELHGTRGPVEGGGRRKLILPVGWVERSETQRGGEREEGGREGGEEGGEERARHDVFLERIRLYRTTSALSWPSLSRPPRLSGRSPATRRRATGSAPTWRFRAKNVLVP